MSKIRLPFFLILFFSSVTSLSSQTDLYWGDVLVFSMAADMGGACGLSPESDQISFVFMEDIETGTTFEMTDNGWETIHANRWDDLEGTLSITRTGGTVPRGTMITLQAINNGGTFSYKFVSPDNNWTITDANVPGGQFNLETGGDQVYWLFGGTWNNNGGFSRRATYSGRTIFGANLSDTWAADGTFNQSNLHPEVLPCYFMTPSAGSGAQPYVKYFGTMEATGYIGWQERMAPQYFNNMPTCNHFLTNGLDFTYGPNIEFIEDMGIWCPLCLSCLEWETPLIFTLPEDGLYDIAYTDGVDTFYLTDLEDGDFIYTVVDTTQLSFQLVWVARAGSDCKIYSHFHSEATISVNSHDPGEYAVVEICSTNNGPLDLFLYLNGTPEGGGTWSPPLQWNQYWYPQFGDGLFTYVFKNDGPPNCPVDTASVRIRFIDFSDTDIIVECDQNGTPNDIFDDRMVVTLTVHGDTTYPFYYASVNEGTVTPLNGMMGEPSTFYMSPGTAIGDGLILTIHAFTPFDCFWSFPIDPPGYCSDPCKYDMISSVSGPEDICIRNCPDNPETINISIEGGTPPYTMDFKLEAPGQLPWVFNGIPAGEENEIQVCIDNVTAPTFNQTAALLTLPQTFANSYVTFTLVDVYDVYGCLGDEEDPFEFTLNIHPLPPITTTTIKLCSEDRHDFNLTDYDPFISNFYDVSWYDGNPLQGGDLIYTPTQVNFDNVVSLWAHVADDYCENAIAVPVQIFPTPDLDTVPDQELCPGEPIVLADIPLVDQGQSNAVYTYHLALPPLPANLVDSLFFIPPDTTTVYVHAVAGFCYDTIPITINVQDFPTFLLEGSPCDLAGGTYSVLITNDGDSLATTHGVVTNNPTGQDIISGIPNDTNITISIFNPSGLCVITIDVTAPNCNCPLINQPNPSQAIYAVCDGEPLPLMTVSIESGLQANWYTVPSGGTPFLTNSLSYQPTNSITSTYYVEAFDEASGCYSIRTPIILQIDPVAQLQLLDDPIGCDGFSIDFNTFVSPVLNGVDGSGQWFALPANTPVSGTVVPANGNSYYYVFTSMTGSCESSDTISTTVNALPSIALYNVVCNDVSLTYDLFFTSDATSVTASTGVLTQVPATDSFMLTGVPFGTSIDFNLNNSVTGCNANIAQAAPDCSCPPLLDATFTSLCSSSGALDLNTFAGPGVSGSWEIVTTPPGSNPATLTGSSFDGQNADAGNYQLRFIRSIIIADCVDTALFDLQLTSAPTADAGIDAVSCAPDVISLNGVVTGTGALFTWTENGSSSIANPNILSTSYTPNHNDFTNGSVNFTLTATDPSGACPTAQETITITIDASAYYELVNAAQVYCDTADIQVDLDALITFGVTSGTWFFPDTVTAPITGGSVFNPSTLEPGNYTVFYTSTTAVPPCEDDTTAVQLTIENCGCPSVALSTPIDGVCSETGSVDLTGFLITTEPGAWSIQSSPPGANPAMINGTVFTTSDSDTGTYVIRFTLNTPVEGCDEFAEINLKVIASPTLELISIDCAEDLQSWEVIITSTTADLVSTPGVVTSLGGNQYLISGIPAGMPLQQLIAMSVEGCTTVLSVPAPDCACTISIGNLPDAVNLCPEDEITFSPLINDPNGTVTAYWIIADDTLYQNNLQTSLPGTYTFVAIDAMGCRDQHDIEVLFYTEMVADVSVQDVECAGQQDGVIFINSIAGGTAPFFVSLNGGPSQEITGFPHSVTNLPDGNYAVVLMDGFSCSVIINLVIESATSDSLSLGPDRIILNGDSVIIDPQLSFVPSSFTWSGDIGLLTTTSLYNVITPQEDQTMILTALDANDCPYADTLNIRVKLESSILVPNVFTPNGDGINDIVFPTADESITLIEYWDIYDNWGEHVHGAKNFAPNDPSVAWDGTFRGKKMRNHVFVWRLSAVNQNGYKIYRYGNITLIR